MKTNRHGAAEIKLDNPAGSDCDKKWIKLIVIFFTEINCIFQTVQEVAWIITFTTAGC